MKQLKIPSLLAPAGSYDALCAAISGGADEVYFGASAHNARSFAKNFTQEEFCKAIRLCRLHGVKSNITVNTICYDKELIEVLRLIYDAAEQGADSFIIQDMGLARQVKQNMPSLEIHASTQCACHNLDGAKRLYDAGFSRIVLARELSVGDIFTITDNLPCETEIFVHGALCVSHSGQCLFSSVVGGRSGNRGACAQPCRMEYGLCSNSACKSNIYALSLKDLSLANHITTLIRENDTASQKSISALKIEGRMKSPEYVYGVTKIYKRLLIERRNATQKENEQLNELFSRQGFTDGYFTQSFKNGIEGSGKMYGIRSNAQKQTTRETQRSMEIPAPKKAIGAVCSFELGKKPTLSFISNSTVATVVGENELSKAQNAAATRQSIEKNLTKLGETPFSLASEDISMTLSQGAFVPVGMINSMRREAAERLEGLICGNKAVVNVDFKQYEWTKIKSPEQNKAVMSRLYFADTKGFFDKIKLYKSIESVVFPLRIFNGDNAAVAKIAESFRVGVLFPRVVLEGEMKKATELLKNAKRLGASYAEVSNIGHIDVVQGAGIEPYGGIGLNISNSCAAQYYTGELGLNSIVLSPELKLGAVRDIKKQADKKYCLYAYGRYPLMVLEGCILRSRKMCDKKAELCGRLDDRIGASFPIYASPRLDDSYPCRNIIYNSVISDLRAKKEVYSSGIDILCISADESGMPM